MKKHAALVQAFETLLEEMDNFDGPDDLDEFEGIKFIRCSNMHIVGLTLENFNQLMLDYGSIGAFTHIACGQCVAENDARKTRESPPKPALKLVKKPGGNPIAGVLPQMVEEWARQLDIKVPKSGKLEQVLALLKTAKRRGLTQEHIPSGLLRVGGVMGFTFPPENSNTELEALRALIRDNPWSSKPGIETILRAKGLAMKLTKGKRGWTALLAKEWGRSYDTINWRLAELRKKANLENIKARFSGTQAAK